MIGGPNSWQTFYWYRGVTSGKWYWEILLNSTPSGTDTQEFNTIGIGDSSVNTNIGFAPGSDLHGYGYLMDGDPPNTAHSFLLRHGAFSSDLGGPGFGDTSILMGAVDMGTGNAWMGANGTWASAGNPGTGANPLITGLTGTQRPLIGLCSNFVQANMTMQSVPSFSVPAGFTYGP